MDTPVKHQTIFFCEEPTVIAQSKEMKLRLFNFTSLELAQNI